MTQAFALLREDSLSAPRSAYLFLAIGLVAASQSGNIIRLGDASAVAISTWRLALASLLLLPLTGGKIRALAHLTQRQYLLLLVAGVALALHFFAWIAAVQVGTVANASIVFSFNPVITATAAYFIFGERAGRALILSIVLGLIGVAFLSGADWAFAPRQLAGDVLALLCSVLFTVYFLLGKHLRRVLPTATYVTAVYGVAALVGVVVMVVRGDPMVHYSGQTWLCFVLMALVPTMLGHTSINHAVRFMDAGWISAALLTEPLLAGLVAYFAWNEPLSLQAAAGYLLISLSVVALVVDARKWHPGSAPSGRRPDPGSVAQT